MADKGQDRELRHTPRTGEFADFVLDKNIFSNIFEKDIRRVYIYKKAERLAKAIHLVAPAFRNSPALRDRLDKVAVGLVDAAILPPSEARDQLSRELLALSSVLSIARSGGLLSNMNAELIAREAHQLLQEVATYEEPRLFLEEAPSLAALSKDMTRERGGEERQLSAPRSAEPRKVERQPQGQPQGHVSDKSGGRRDAIISILRSKGSVYIKDISTVIRDVSEKTIQRELQTLVEEGKVSRKGERRWTTYSLKG
jgi:DNA-binding transcriptional ArsR family regulator